MDPFIRDQINTLRKSEDPQQQAQATILEVLSNHGEELADIKAQTTKTNGRVTKLENQFEGQQSACPGRCLELEKRLEKLEKPAQTATILWKAAGYTGAHIVVFLTLLFAFMATDFGKSAFEKRDKAVADDVAKQLLENDRKQTAAIEELKHKK